MKSILSFAFAMVALFSVTTFSSFRHNSTGDKKTGPTSNLSWNVDPCITSSGVVTGKITGIGNGNLTIEVTGEAYCDNPGDNKPPAWQGFSKSVSVPAPKNGNYELGLQLQLCKPRWSSTAVQNVYVTVTQGSSVLGPTYCPPCQ